MIKISFHQRRTRRRTIVIILNYHLKVERRDLILTHYKSPHFTHMVPPFSKVKSDKKNKVKTHNGRLNIEISIPPSQTHAWNSTIVTNIPQLLFLKEKPSPRTPDPNAPNAEELPVK